MEACSEERQPEWMAVVTSLPTPIGLPSTHASFNGEMKPSEQNCRPHRGGCAWRRRGFLRASSLYSLEGTVRIRSCAHFALRSSQWSRSNQTHRKWLNNNSRQNLVFLPEVWTVGKGVDFSFLMLLSWCWSPLAVIPGPHLPEQWR